MIRMLNVILSIVYHYVYIYTYENAQHMVRIYYISSLSNKSLSQIDYKSVLR